MARSLPANPNLEQLKKQAKDLLKAFRAGDTSVCEVMRYHYRFARASNENILKAEVTLQEVQHALALDYGFTSWKQLKDHLDAAKNAPAPSPGDVQWFFEQCATGLNSGEPLLKTFLIALNQTSSAPLKEVITAVGEHIERGGTFSEALVEHPLAFNETCVAMVRTGEALGTLEVLVAQIAELRIAAQGPASDEDVAHALRYVNHVLWDMHQNGLALRTITKSETLPVAAGTACDFAHLVNRLKTMSGLSPVSFSTPTDGHFQTKIGGRLYEAKTRFDDHADDPSCEIGLAEKDASSAVSVNEAAITGESIATDLIHAAVIARASDIHMEWIGGRMIVRYRIDGRMQESEKSIPDELQTAVITAIKEMADLDTETDDRLQSGRITTHIGDKEFDLRVSVMPCVGGESAVLRILDTSNLRISLDRLGLTGENIATLKDWTQRPNGMFFVSGPTGSGKTTTLYSVLMDMNREEKKIITCEDPVEYVIDGINQQQVDGSKGITFHNTVREIMKQDPDVIMVGEIRDLDTLSCCVQMALTGHLVFSSLHTDDAAGAVRRLVDIGVEPYLVSSTLIGIMSQRLVRIICDNCREEYQLEPEVQRRLGSLTGATVYRGRGCDKCGHTGYRGRVGILEMLQMDDALRGVVGRKGSAAELREQAVKSGMIRMREDGLAKVAQGITTIDEVLRVTAGDTY